MMVTSISQNVAITGHAKHLGKPKYLDLIRFEEKKATYSVAQSAFQYIIQFLRDGLIVSYIFTSTLDALFYNHPPR